MMLCIFLKTILKDNFKKPLFSRFPSSFETEYLLTAKSLVMVCVSDVD